MSMLSDEEEKLWKSVVIHSMSERTFGDVVGVATRARLCAEYADNVVREYRKRQKEGIA